MRYRLQTTTQNELKMYDFFFFFYFFNDLSWYYCRAYVQVRSTEIYGPPRGTYAPVVRVPIRLCTVKLINFLFSQKKKKQTIFYNVHVNA